MSKLIYIYGDDSRLMDTLIKSMRQGGYSLEYTNLSDEDLRAPLHADIALICRSVTPETKLTLGGLTVDLDNVCAIDENGNTLHFTPTEFSVLTYLIRNSNKAVSRDELLPAVWGCENHSGTRMADDTIKRLRKKLVDTRLSIETIWGYGFKATEKAE